MHIRSFVRYLLEGPEAPIITILLAQILLAQILLDQNLDSFRFPSTPGRVRPPQRQEVRNLRGRHQHAAAREVLFAATHRAAAPVDGPLRMVRATQHRLPP